LGHCSRDPILVAAQLYRRKGRGDTSSSSLLHSCCISKASANRGKRMTGDMDSMRFNHLRARRPNLCLNATTPLTSIADWCHRSIALLRPALIRCPVFAHQPVSFWHNFSTSGAVNKRVGAKGPRHCQPALRKKCVTNLPLASLLRERKGELDRQLPRSFLAGLL